MEMTPIEEIRKAVAGQAEQPKIEAPKDGESSASAPVVAQSDSNRVGDATDVSTLGLKHARDKFNKGEMTADQLGEAVADAIATGKAIESHADDYAEQKHEELEESFETKKQEAKTRHHKAQNENNEVFYAKFRPIFEFDFSHITGKPKSQNVTSEESKSYSKTLMVITICCAAWLWLLIAVILYVFKGINAVVKLISDFTQQAKIIIVTGFCLLGAYIVLKVITSLVSFYTGIQILPI